MNSKFYKIFFGIIWLLFCVAAFFIINDSTNKSFNYIFYMVIGLFALIGIGIIISGIKSSKEEVVEEVGNDKLEELKKEYPIISKVENTVLFARGIKYIIAGVIAGLAALIMAIFRISGLSLGKKTGEILFDIVGITMFAFASVVFLSAGIKNIKLSKNNKNNGNNG